MLGFAIDLIQWLQCDQQRSQAERHQRDRRIALALPQGAEAGAEVRSTAARLTALRDWWAALQSEPDAAAVSGREPGSPAAAAAAPLTGRRVERTRTLVSVALVLLGLILGSGVAAAALRYDGSAPVNLVGAIGLLVLLPAVLFVATLILLPGRLPFAGWLQDIVAALNPGQWASQWLNSRFHGLGLGWRGAAPRYLGDSEPQLDLPGVSRLARWQLLVYSQQLALGYALGALGMLIGLVTFSDMAFGWSTTLDVSAERVAGWVDALAWPWAVVWPAAAPGLELVEASRFYRAAGVEAARVAQLGNWWPFLLMAMLCYALLPRLLLLLFARRRLRLSEQRLLLEHPAVQKLLQRMTTPIAEHLKPPPEADAPQPVSAAGTGSEGAAIALAATTSRIVCSWNSALPPERLPAWLPGTDAAGVLLLNSSASLAEEQALLAAQPRVERVIIFTKAWEPPLLELQDLLVRLTTLLQPGGQVLVVPVGIDGAAPKTADLAIWRQTLELVDDVRLTVWSPP
ncbi:MAG: DUF2868 domain-containing protein [Pseudomonadota bacterium]